MLRSTLLTTNNTLLRQSLLKNSIYKISLRSMTNETQANSFYELKGTDINGNTFTFDRFKNKVS